MTRRRQNARRPHNVSADKTVPLVTLASFSEKRNVRVWCPSVCLSVCPVGTLTVTRQAAGCDVASLHFGPTIRRTDVLYI